MRSRNLHRAAAALLLPLTLSLASLGALAQPAAADDPQPPGPVAKGNPAFTADVLAPLKVTDWADFEHDLAAVKAYGVDAVSVDVWWGDVEKAGNRFDWSYYDRVFGDITAAGLDVAPIFSFHQCGGNVGDDYTSLLPAWLWQKYAGRTLDGVKLGLKGLQHKSEQGNFSPESVQGWADDLVLNEYADFTKAFTRHFEPRFGSDISEIEVSLGPSGELRYPSYNSHDTGTGYPTRGGLQSYSKLAVRDLQTWALHRYHTIRGVNRAWGTSYTTRGQIQPPADPDAFFDTRAYLDTQYGRDFIDWYNGSLVEHGRRVLQDVSTALRGHFPGVALGYKVPGVHWEILDPQHPRAAEVTDGLVQTSVDMDAWSTGHGYQRIIELAHHVRGRHVVMYFTALEMGDNPGPPAYSLAKTLVGWIGDYAYRVHTDLKGENALSGGVQYDYGWDQINDAFDTWGYLGLTVLRMSDVAEGTGATRYAQFIEKYRG